MGILRNLLFLDEETCAFCKEEESERCGLCHSCYERLEEVDGLIPVGDTDTICRYPLFYNNYLREKMHAFKFRDESHLYRVFGDILYEYAMRHGLLEGIDLLLPIPLHPSMERRRGYNQSALLARRLSKRSGLPYEEDLLQKRKHTREQNKLGYAERMTNLIDSMTVAEPSALEGKRVLIVDDFITTGATMVSVLEALRTGKPAAVFAIALTSSGRLD